MHPYKKNQVDSGQENGTVRQSVPLSCLMCLETNCTLGGALLSCPEATRPAYH